MRGAPKNRKLDILVEIIFRKTSRRVFEKERIRFISQFTEL